MSKNSSKRGGNKPAAQRIPKGFQTPFGKPGQFVSKTVWAIIEPQIRAAKKTAQRAEKNRREKEKRAATRAARMQKMAANVTGSAVHDAIQGWGSTSTSRIPESKKVYWHGVFTITGLSDANLKKILALANSSHRKPHQDSDGNYSVTLTPGYGWKTPKNAFEPDADGKTFFDRQAEQFIQDFGRHGGQVEYHGAFYNPGREP